MYLKTSLECCIFRQKSLGSAFIDILYFQLDVMLLTELTIHQKLSELVLGITIQLYYMDLLEDAVQKTSQISCPSLILTPPTNSANYTFCDHL